MALNTIGIELGYKTTGSTYTKLNDLVDVPAIGGDPEKIDTTTYDNSVRQYIPGVRDLGDVAFKFLYDNSSDTTSYAVLKQLATTGEAVDWELKYPDGTKDQFSAIPTVKKEAAPINGRLEFTLSLSLQSDITEVNPY